MALMLPCFLYKKIGSTSAVLFRLPSLRLRAAAASSNRTRSGMQPVHHLAANSGAAQEHGNAQKQKAGQA